MLAARRSEACPNHGEESGLGLSSVFTLQVVSYLAGCGLQSCPMLLAKGYPDIGWNPCGGERYLDFLRFAVFVNGEAGWDLWGHWLKLPSDDIPQVTLSQRPPLGGDLFKWTCRSTGT